jgi:hypothetical protein
VSNSRAGAGWLSSLPPVIIGPPPPERPEPAPRRGFVWWVIACALTLWGAQALIARIMLRQ